MANKKKIADTILDDAQKAPAHQTRIRDLELQVERLECSLAHARKTRPVTPKQVKGKAAKGSYVRVFCPDTHGHSIDPAAAAAFLKDLKLLRPRKLYLLGDHLDCSGFLSQHFTLGHLSELEHTYEDDVASCNDFLDRVQAAIDPQCSIIYLEGNHEARIEKWIINAVLRNGQDGAFLRRLMGPEAVLHLDKRNIRYISKGKFYDGCKIQGTIKDGSLYITHGTRHGRGAAQSMLQRFGANVVFGHIHRLMSASSRTVAGGEIHAWSCGCLSLQQPTYMHCDPSEFVQGYGIQIVRGRSYLHVNVPITDGVSSLSGLERFLHAD